MTTTLKETTYHDVLRHAFRDRGGFEPDLLGHGDSESANPITRNLEAEHDWVLLIFARSQRLRQWAARRADELAGQPADSRGDVLNGARANLHYHVCCALAGLDYDSHVAGYLTFETAFLALAE